VRKAEVSAVVEDEPTQEKATETDLGVEQAAAAASVLPGSSEGSVEGDAGETAGEGDDGEGFAIGGEHEADPEDEAVPDDEGEDETDDETDDEADPEDEADAYEDDSDADEDDSEADEDESDSDDEAPLGFELPTAMTRMLFVDIVLVLPSTHPVVVLQEMDVPYRELRIPIGGPEGIAIGYAARQVATPRPLTHELMTQLLELFNLSLDVVNITGLTGGVFTAELVVSGPAGQRTLDCRPSDAIALALRQRIAVPIMAAPEVLDRAAAAAAGSN